MTNVLGEYELSFATPGAAMNQKGAAIGPHIVRITSAVASGVSSGGGGDAGGSPSDLGPTDDTPKPPGVLIPDKYNASSELKADVIAGENLPKNFDLKIAN